MSWASYTNLGANIGGETSSSPRADDVCPHSPRLFFYPSVTDLFFSFQLEKCFQFLNHFFLLISTPNSPQSFLIVQDNEKQILKKSITPKCISKVEQAPICKSSELPGEETCGRKEFRLWESNSEKSHTGKMKRNYLLGREPSMPVNSVTDLMNWVLMI